MHLPTSPSGTDRYRFESRKTGLVFQSNKIKNQSGVDVSSEVFDTSYHLLVKVRLKQVNNAMVPMIDHETDMLEMDMQKKDVLQMMKENGYHCQG